MAHYSIKDIETLSGVKAHTLRIWEQRYDFLKPHRTDTNIRYYTDEQLRKLLNISLLNKHGVKISRIANMSEAQLVEEVRKLSEGATTPDSMMDALVHSMLDFDEARFEKVLSSSIMKLGFQRCFTELIFPFMVRTGMMWATGAVRPSQEHFITSLVRRKLCVAIDSQYIQERPDAKRYVLFLPEGETHELLLLFTEYMLRVQNHKVAYLGNSLPFEDVEFINSVFKPNYFITYFTVPLKDNTVPDYIMQMSSAFPDALIVAGGAQIESMEDKSMPSNVQLVRNLDHLMKIIYSE